jgi:hypothetical protein
MTETPDFAQLAATTAPTDDTLDTNGQRPSPPRLERLRERLYVGREVCDLPPPRSLIDGLVFTPGESVLYGPPKVGKSFLALDLALSIATGLPFMGRNVTAGRVVYVVAEGVGGLGQRVDAWCQYHDIQDPAGAAFLAAAINLSDRHAVEDLCALAGEWGAALITIDTLARCTVGADENSAKEMGTVIEAVDTLRDLAGHVQLVHHSGKDVTKGMRGTSAVLGAVDTVFQLSGGRTAVQVRMTDQKDALLVDPWFCRLEPVADSAVITPAADSTLQGAFRRVLLDALEVLPPENRTSTNWKQMATTGDDAVSERTFYRIKQDLLDVGYVQGERKRGGLYSLRDDPDEEV